jgi:hypothetical protein
MGEAFRVDLEGEEVNRKRCAHGRREGECIKNSKCRVFTHDLTKEEMARVGKFLNGLGPYQSDVWSNSYPGEILDFLNERKR